MKNKRLELRNRVWQKYNERCGYCGQPIKFENMQVDHAWPLKLKGYYKNTLDVESFENLMPSCRSCNHYKRGDTPEQFKRNMKTLHERIAKIYIVNVAINFGMLKITPFDGTFYFEKIQKD